MTTHDVRTPRWYVTVDGVTRTLLAGRVVLSARAFVSTFSGDGLLSEGRPANRAALRVYAGYGAAVYPIFGGEQKRRRVIARPNDLQFEGAGYLARLKDPIGVAPTIIDAVDGPTSDPTPLVTYDSLTAGDIIVDVLTRYGVPAYSLQDSGDLFGELEPIPVYGDTTGESIVQDLDDAENYRTFDGPDGVVHRLPWSRVASGTAARTFTDDQDLYAGQLEASDDAIRNRVIVFGLTQKGTTGVEFTPTGLAEEASALVPTPPGFRAATYNLPLLETGDRCQAWAEAKLGELNRETGELPVELVAGDATLWPGMTVAVVSSTLDLDGSERFLIEEVQHDLSESEGFNTSLSLYLTAEGAGYSPNLPPVALIAMKGMRETLADGSDQYEVGLDGSASYDPELGIAGVVSYVWDGSPTAPTPLGVGKTASVIYAAGIPAGATVTLTVTDDLGATGHLTLPVTTASAQIVIRDIIAAVLTKLETSRDGQRTWTSVQVSGADIPAVGTCEIGAAEYTFAWTAAGALYKVLADDTATLVTPGGGNITACTIHTDQAGGADGRVWAGGTGGQVWFSPDHGVTWEARAAAPNGATVTYIQESFFAEGQMELLAGNVYYTSFSAAGDWVASYTHPNTALTAYRFTSGFGQGFIGFSGPDNGLDAGAKRIRERTDAVDIGPATGVLSVVGLTQDVYEDILYVADNNPVGGGGGVGRLWSAPAKTSGNLTGHTYDDATYGHLRHMIRDGGMPGLLYLAAANALLKSPDGLATVQAMRTLSGGREGMMIGYGAERALLVATIIRNAVGTARTLYLGLGPSFDPTPANWYRRLGFDDSAWTPDVAESGAAGTGAFYDAIPGGTWTTGHDVADGLGTSSRWLYRLPFTLPPTILRARLTLALDDYQPGLMALYVNGTDRTADLPAASGTTPRAVRVLTIAPADLAPGPNLIAIQVPNAGGPTGLQLMLEVNW